MDRNSSSTKVFDFSTQASIMSISAGVRKSELPTSVKNELRDLIFLYTSGGGDDSTRIALEQKLTTHGVEPTTSFKPNQSGAVVKTEEVKPVLEFGTYRPVPSFAVPVVEIKENTPRPSISVDTAKLAVKQFKAQATKTTEEPTLVKSSQFTPSHSPVEYSVPVEVSTPTSVPEPKKASEVVPSSDEIKELTSEIKVEAKNENKGEVKEQSTSTAQTESSTTNNKYLDRIREIKNIVNSKVGNPVNLVDIDNQVGREYMNALLDAMKKLSNASTAELDSAMQRLELAFSAVDKVVTERSLGVNSASVENVTPEVVKENVTPKITETIVTPVKSVEVLVKTPVEIQKDVPKPKEKSGFETDSNVDIDKKLKTTNVPIKPIPAVRVMGEQVSVNPSRPSTPISAPIPAKADTFVSLAEEKKVPSFADLPTSLPRKEGEVGNPLYTDEIDAGLDELLSDWSLFKKSGLFGTGPKGREHPLFQKIASIQVPLILAGRFDGATQEVQQSITDYMNGWRYEQGIVYAPGETFDVYLRRVIKHIIDLQKKRNSA